MGVRWVPYYEQNSQLAFYQQLQIQILIYFIFSIISRHFLRCLIRYLCYNLGFILSYLLNM
jgi:hypothetical protein